MYPGCRCQVYRTPVGHSRRPDFGAPAYAIACHFVLMPASVRIHGHADKGDHNAHAITARRKHAAPDSKRSECFRGSRALHFPAASGGPVASCERYLVEARTRLQHSKLAHNSHKQSCQACNHGCGSSALWRGGLCCVSLVPKASLASAFMQLATIMYRCMCTQRQSRSCGEHVRFNFGLTSSATSEPSEPLDCGLLQSGQGGESFAGA